MKLSFRRSSSNVCNCEAIFLEPIIVPDDSSTDRRWTRERCHKITRRRKVLLKILSTVIACFINQSFVRSFAIIIMSHELIYFNGKGRAEAIRILLHAAGVEFKDTRLGFPDFQALKPTTPLGSLPILKINDQSHVQSTALGRYAAKLAGLYPTDDPLAALVVDEACETCNELVAKLPFGASPNLEAKRKEFQATVMPVYAAFLESLIQQNGGTYVKGQTMTLADVMIYVTVAGMESGNFDFLDAQFFKAYPGITATAQAVAANDKVKAYYASKEN